MSIGVKFALEKYLLHDKKRHLRSTSLRSQPTMDAKLMLAFLHFALSNFRHAYLRSAKGCIFQISETHSAFRKWHLAKFFLSLAFLSEVLLKSVDVIVILLKSRPERSRPEKFRLVRCAVYFITKQLFNLCYRDICRFSPAVRFISLPLVGNDSRNLEKKF